MITHSPQETQQYAAIIYPYLIKGGIVCLYGDLGTGKTLFTKALLKQFGIHEDAVKSPTYTLFREHKIKNGLKIYHADFYRIEEVDEFTREHIQEILHKPDALAIIEWAERIKLLLPIPRLDVKFEYIGKEKRSITVHYIREPLLKTKILELYEKYHVPQHIQAHMVKVADVAVTLANKINSKNPGTVNTVLLEQAALLHDLVKVCDIPIKQQNNMMGTAGDKAFWRQLFEQYNSIGHAEAAAEILRSHGEDFLAAIIAKHAYASIIDPNPVKRLQTWEEKLLYYADKRVKHDQFVSLKERLKDGRERYLPDGNLPENEKEIEDALLMLEKEILKMAEVLEF